MDHIELFKLLSDETRIRILNLFLEGDLCVCELVEALDLTQPKISKHIAKIRTTRLITSRRHEQFIYYSLNKENKLYPLLVQILSHINSQDVFKNDVSSLHKIESFTCER